MINKRATLTNFLGPVVRITNRAAIVGTHHLPLTGPALVVSLTPLDVTGVRAHLTRPVRALLGTTSLPRDLALAPLWEDVVIRADPGLDAHHEALAELHGGAVVLTDAVSTDLGYLTLVTNVPVLALAHHGARFFLAPVDVPEDASVPLNAETIRRQGELIRQRLADHDLAARQRSQGMMTQ